MEAVEEVAKGTKVKRSSARLPRKAIKADVDESRWATWAIANLGAATGLTASIWIRDITPIPKDPGVIRDAERLRPISTTDDLESFTDALWFTQPPRQSGVTPTTPRGPPPQELLTKFAGHGQMGGGT